MFYSTTDDLKWTVRKEAVQTESGVIIPKHMAIIRDDNNVPLSIMTDGYQPFQNHELIELLERVSNQTGLEIKKSGMFGDGEKVFIQLKSNDLKLGNDKIEGYLTGINSFDGSTSLAFGPTNITISCQNTFFAAFREMNSKVRHTKNMGVRIDDICKSLENVVQEEKKIFDSIVQLSETRFDDLLRDDIIKRLFNIDKDISLNDNEKISTNTKNKLSTFYVDLNGEINEKGDNMWGLFSGVTKYTTHHLSKSTDSMENKMFGTYGKREREIFNTLVAQL